jgi:hypothetical protein
VGTKRYRSDITVGSLKVAESRIIADLLLQGVDEAAWKAALLDENVLQTRSSVTAVKLGRLLRHRLLTMDAGLWRLVKDGPLIVATHACLAASVKHSPLLSDFLGIVVAEQYRIFSPVLPGKLWSEYIEDCHGRDPRMPEWSASTVARLRSAVFQILAQAGYIQSTRAPRLQTVHVAKEVLAYLRERNEEAVLRCIQVSP